MKYDLTFICYEMKCTEKNVNWGYPCRGYPSADKLVPAFERIGAKIQVIEFKNYANVNLTPDSDKKDIFKDLGPLIQSDNVVIEWDGITSKRDYKAMFDWGKNILIIPHHEGRISGYGSTDEVEREFRKYLTERSVKIIFELQTLRDLWKEFECNKFELFYPPTRTGIKYDKIESRKKLGIKTRYAIICWGQYTGKNYEDILYWLADWQDTSILFCGSGSPPAKKVMLDFAKEIKISDKVFFSEHGISDEDSDLWFSASDISACPRTFFGTATSVYIMGQGKICVVPRNPPDKITDKNYWNGYTELEQISGVVATDDLKRTTRNLLLDKETRKVLESKSIEYARKNTFENYARKIMKALKEKI